MDRWFCRAGNCWDCNSKHLPVTLHAPACVLGQAMALRDFKPLFPILALHSQLVGAVAGLVHPVTFLQQLEELLNGHTGVG